MECFEKYQNDRICELCKISNNVEFEMCKNKYDETMELLEKLENIKSKCPYRSTSWDEYDMFYSCSRNGNGYGRFADGCICTLQCEKYIN